MARIALYAALSLALSAASTAATDGIYARDGKGNPVSWWVVLKLPMLARSDPESEAISPTPCDCPPPDCSNLATKDANTAVRATGLCYLYADSTNSSLRYFRELGYDCLGQGGDDPVSHTLRHIQPKTRGDSPEAKYWVMFNDQLNGIADSNKTEQSKRVCSGSDTFSAHAKGTIAFDGVDGGFYLQTSTPNFPDPSTVDGARGDSFIPLGCQRDNNVQFAQHMMAMSVGMMDLNMLGQQLQTARLCSGNFYHDLRGALASSSLLSDGDDPGLNANFSAVYQALLEPSLQAKDTSPTFQLNLRAVQSPSSSAVSYSTHISKREDVYRPLSRNESLFSTAAKHHREPPSVTVTVKTPRAPVPPWALVSEALQSDLSVASWWDGSFGIPNICAGDVYTATANQFCLNNMTSGVSLNSNGSAKFNVENLIEASWRLPNMSKRIRWHLVGGSRRDGNHAKWAISTPRYRIGDESQLVTFADLNMEGFPCSKACNGSQAGRGGTFFTLSDATLHSSFAASLITKACPCVSPHDGGDGSFVSLRMCGMGCWRKVEAHFEPEELPKLSTAAASFWDHN